MSTKKLTPAEYDALPWLHIYAQYAYHDPVRILGTREALVALRDGINRALEHENGEAEAEAITNDGEGYGVEIKCVPRRAVHDARLPYTADYAFDPGIHAPEFARAVITELERSGYRIKKSRSAAPGPLPPPPDVARLGAGGAHDDDRMIKCLT